MLLQRMIGLFRRQFTSGLLIMVPLITTIFVVVWFFRALDQILGRYFAKLLGDYIVGVGFVSLILLIWVVGVLGRTYIGSKLNQLKDFLIERIPLIGSVFASVKKVSDGLLEMNTGSFEQVVLVEYPRQGLYAIGFVTSRQPSQVHSYPGGVPEGRIAHVFVPSVPNPTSGYILLVPEEQLHRLMLSVEDAMKLILSLGMISPSEYNLKKFSFDSVPATRTAALSRGGGENI
ncbi:DUF502 domain-containing protein [bacterium]|nr:DUF502 domain-containing protein [bacterium]